MADRIAQRRDGELGQLAQASQRRPAGANAGGGARGLERARERVNNPQAVERINRNLEAQRLRNQALAQQGVGGRVNRTA